MSAKFSWMLQRELTGLAVFLEEAPQIGTSPRKLVTSSREKFGKPTRSLGRDVISHGLSLSLSCQREPTRKGVTSEKRDYRL